MGLLKTAAKVGVASSVHGRVQRRQQQRWAAQDQSAAAMQFQQAPQQFQAPPPQPAAAPAAAATSAPAPDMDQKLAQLKQLGDLRDAGILTDAEFEAKKNQILGA